MLRWKLVARHRAGSLEAAVGAARTRNIALSFGVLLLMAVTVGVLARTARRAERLARQQIEFVAAVSHELRTPVSVIGAAAENLADGLVVDPARVKQYGTRIQTESRRLGDTVERVLLYAGIEAGHAVGHRMPVPVGTLIGDAVTASQRRHRRIRSDGRGERARRAAAGAGGCARAAFVPGQPDRQRRSSTAARPGGSASRRRRRRAGRGRKCASR